MTHNSTQDARAQAQAEKAYRKALRPWYKKKRFLLPLVFVALMLLLAMCTAATGGNSETVSTQPGQEASAEAPEGEAPAEEPAPEPPAEPAPPRFAGQQENDIVGDAGAELVRRDVRLTMTPLQPFGDSYFDGVCSTVTIVNDKSQQIDFNTWDFKLQDPNGTIRDPSFYGENNLSSGQLAPGGTVSGNVCFDGGATPGQYALIYDPMLSIDSARAVWINQL